MVESKEEIDNVLKILSKIKDRSPDTYRHLIGLIVAAFKELKTKTKNQLKSLGTLLD